MSDTAEPLPPRETLDAPRDEVPPPPPPLYTPKGQQPPPYAAAPELCPPPKAETTCIYQPTTGYESFRDISPEASSDTTPLTASSSFEDKTVRRAFVRKVCTTPCAFQIIPQLFFQDHPFNKLHSGNICFCNTQLETAKCVKALKRFWTARPDVLLAE